MGGGGVSSGISRVHTCDVAIVGLSLDDKALTADDFSGRGPLCHIQREDVDSEGSLVMGDEADLHAVKGVGFEFEYADSGASREDLSGVIVHATDFYVFVFVHSFEEIFIKVDRKSTRLNSSH